MSDEQQGTGILNGWVFDKRINLSELLTVLTVFAACTIWGLRLENRVAMNERAIQNVQKRADEDRTRLTRIEDKIDRVIEKLSDRRDRP